MNRNEKRKIREEIALKRISEPMAINQKLLQKQVTTIIQLICITNDEIADNLICVNQVLETFEWLPKGEHHITVKIV